MVDHNAGGSSGCHGRGGGGGGDVELGKRNMCCAKNISLSSIEHKAIKKSLMTVLSLIVARQ